MGSLIDCQTCAGCQRDTFGAWASEAGITERQFLEKHERAILLHDRASFARMGIHPSTNGLHGNLLAYNLALFDERTANRGIGPAILACIGDPTDGPVLQTNAPRSLNMEKEHG